MEGIPSVLGQVRPKPLLAFCPCVCRGEIKISEAFGPCEAQVQVCAGLGSPLLFVGSKSAKEIVMPHSSFDKMLQHCRAERVADLVSSKPGVETFLQNVNRVAISKAELRGGGYAI